MKRAYLIPLLWFAIFCCEALLLGGWIVDDAGISFTYVRNLALGHGLVAQPGLAPVEGFSNFAWVLLLAPFYVVRLFDPIVTPKLISAALVLGSFLLVQHTLRRSAQYPGVSTFFVLACVTVNTAFVVWTVSGLENPLYAFLTVLLLHLVIRLDDRPATASIPVAVVAALIGMTRPDGVVYFAVFPAFLLGEFLFWKRRPEQALKDAVLYFAVLGVVYGAFLAFQFGYFGDVVPNTYYAKRQPTVSLVKSLVLLRPDIVTRIYELSASVAGQFGSLVLMALFGATVYLVSLGRFTRRQFAIGLMLLFSMANYLLLPQDWMGEYRYATPFFIPFYAFLFVTAEAVYVSARVHARRGLWVTRVLMIGFVAGTLVLCVPRTARFVRRPTVPFADVCALFGDRYNEYARQLDLTAASLLLPDVGGALDRSKLRIYDLGALTDKSMADAWKRGKGALHDHIFSVVKPTFIHVHGGWASAVEFETDPRFLRDYAPIHEGVESLYKEDAYFVGDYARRDAVGDRLEALRRIRLPGGRRD